MSARNGYWVEKDGGTHATCVRWKDLFVHSPPKKAKVGLCESPEGDARGLTRQAGLGFSPFDPPWTLTSEEPHHHFPGLGGVR